ncbi:MAG TPA: DUF4255 domain-containing protein [Vicinamibacteria bacterium]
MSHLVIGEVSEFLRHTLWLGIKEDAVTSQLVTAEQNIVLTNPGQTNLPQGVVRQMSLWLYQVLPNEHLRNPSFVRRAEQPPPPAGGGPPPPVNDDVQFYPPLVLNLFYLLTPSIQADGGGANDQIADQRLLGRAMQIFHDQAVMRMDSRQNPGQADELHLSLATRTIEELAEVWEAMQQPYRLSVCYEVRVVRIDSLRRVQGGRVTERATEFAPVAEA